MNNLCACWDDGFLDWLHQRPMPVKPPPKAQSLQISRLWISIAGIITVFHFIKSFIHSSKAKSTWHEVLLCHVLDSLIVHDTDDNYPSELHLPCIWIILCRFCTWISCQWLHLEECEHTPIFAQQSHFDSSLITAISIRRSKCEMFVLSKGLIVSLFQFICILQHKS
jgi:hypothetical protein